MITNPILLGLAVFPVLLLALYVYRKDKFEKEPFGMLVKAFFFGCLSVIPAIILEGILSTPLALSGLDELPFFGGLYNGFVVAGFSEELCKLLLLTWAVWKSPNFNEYFDGVVYATFVSLGFACIENISYVFFQDSIYEMFGTSISRAIFAVPGHFLFGVTMGYFYSLARFQPERRRLNLAKALIFPMLLHGTYDSLLMIPEGSDDLFLNGIFFLVFIGFDICLWIWGTRRIRHMQELSSTQESQGPQRPEGPHNDGFKNIDWNV